MLLWWGCTLRLCPPGVSAARGDAVLFLFQQRASLPDAVGSCSTMLCPTGCRKSCGGRGLHYQAVSTRGLNFLGKDPQGGSSALRGGWLQYWLVSTRGQHDLG